MDLKTLTSAQIIELMRTYRDSNRAEPDRSALMAECSRRGKKLLEQVGWPTQLDALYINRYHPAFLETLGELLEAEEETLQNRTNKHEGGLDGKLHSMTNGMFHLKGVKTAGSKKQDLVTSLLPAGNRNGGA